MPHLGEAALGVLSRIAGIEGTDHGLAPIMLNPASGGFEGRRITLGARGDSYYEYLLKQWLLGGRQDEALLQCASRRVPPSLRRKVQPRDRATVTRTAGRCLSRVGARRRPLCGVWSASHVVHS